MQLFDISGAYSITITPLVVGFTPIKVADANPRRLSITFTLYDIDAGVPVAGSFGSVGLNPAITLRGLSVRNIRNLLLHVNEYGPLTQAELWFHLEAAGTQPATLLVTEIVQNSVVK